MADMPDAPAEVVAAPTPAAAAAFDADAAAPAAAAATPLPPLAGDQSLASSASPGLDMLASASAIAAPNPIFSLPVPLDLTDGAGRGASSHSSQHSRRQDVDSSSSAPTSLATAFQWGPVIEDNSQPSADELKIMDRSPDVSALDHEHWKALTFESLDDPEHVTLEDVFHPWLVENFNGTADAPSTSLVVHSPSFKLAGLSWRLKLYPKGNETGYVSIYLECESLQSKDPGIVFEDGGDASHTSELMRPILPPLLIPSAPPTGPVRRRRCLSVQFSIIMYNPQVPTVHYHRATTHMFSKEAPDAGFSRFGPASIRDLGRRQYGARAPMLQADTIAFCAHVRVIKDPTGLLFGHHAIYQSSLSQYTRLGLQRFEKHDFLEVGPNLLAAVLVLCLLSPIRKLIYSAGQLTGQPCDGGSDHRVCKPLLRSLQEFLEDIRDPTVTGEPVSCTIIDVLENYGVSVADAQSYDVLMLIEKLRTILDRELQDVQTPIKDLFMPNGLRCKLPQDKTTSVRAGLRILMETEHILTDTFPRVMIVELSRWGFDHHTREWKRNSKAIALNDPLRLTKDSTGTYRLYSLVMHRGKYRSDRFQAFVRPDAKTWYKFDGNASSGLEATQATSKEALDEGQKYAYLAIYVKDELAKSEMMEDSKTFQGHPEVAWQTTKTWSAETGNACRPFEASINGDEDVEMPDASIVLNPAQQAAAYFPKQVPSTLEDHLGQEYHKGECNERHWEGKGYHIYFNGDVYDGIFHEGKRHGTGFQTFQNGDTFEGEWAADKMHGDGVFTQAKTGNTYRGMFKDGQQHAPGTTTWRVAESRDRTCHVCWVQAQDAVFMDCGHVCACLDCARQVDTCPICRRPVIRAVKLHFS